VTIDHPDVLGAFLSAGIQRKKIGDIVVHGDTIQILVTEDITPYLVANVTAIKKASVSFSRIPLANRLSPQDKWQERTATCSSLRIDVIVKEIYQMSRQQELEIIKKGLVKVNFQ